MGLDHDMLTGIAVSHGVLLTKGARLQRPDNEVAPPEPQPA
jgi:hypothetical protein